MDRPRSIAISCLPRAACKSPRHGETAMGITRFAAALLALVAVFAVDDTAQAQNYPSRPVKIIVPYAPGGPNDIMARILAQKLTEALGGTFVVENLPGGGSTIGTG